MPTVDERLTRLENSVLKLATNKVEIAALTARNTIEDTRYVDLYNAIVNIQARLENLETWIVGHIATGATG